MTTTEQAFAALFALVEAATLPDGSIAFKSAERDIRKWDEIEKLSEVGLPALFQEQSAPQFQSAPNIPTIIRLYADLAIVCDASDPVAVPSSTLNGLVDALLAALAPDPSDDGRQTLGDLVYDCKPTSRGWYKEATRIDSLCYALVPVEIILTQ